LLPLIAATLWGVYAAPKSKTRLTNPSLILFKLALFAITAFLIYQTGHGHLALIFMLVAFLNEIAGLAVKE
jgi:hypothetical protein